MSFTKKVKTVICKMLIIIFLVYLSINSNNLFVYASLEQFHNISDNGCRHSLDKGKENR